MIKLENHHKKLAVLLLSLCLMLTGVSDIALCFGDAHAHDANDSAKVNDLSLVARGFAQGCDSCQLNSENCCVDIYLATVNKCIRLPLSLHQTTILGSGFLLDTDQIFAEHHKRPSFAATIPKPAPPLFIQTSVFLI